MTITTPRSRNRSTSVFTIVALLATFGMSAATRARAADRPLNDVEGIDFALKLPIAERGFSDGTSNTIVFAERASAAGSDHTWFEVTADPDEPCGGLISSPLGVVRGIVQVEPGARKAWATFPSEHGIGLVEIADPRGAGPYQGRLVGVLPVSAAFRPDSLRAGIIGGPVGFAIDIGGSEAKVIMQDIHFTRSSLPDPAPALFFQDGDALFLYAFDGSAFRLLERKTIPPGTAAFTLEDVLISGFWIGAEPGSSSCLAGAGG